MTFKNTENEKYVYSYIRLPEKQVKIFNLKAFLNIQNFWNCKYLTFSKC